MRNTRFSAVVVVLAAAVGVGFWTTRADQDTTATPVDILLAEAAEVLDRAPATGAAEVIQASPMSAAAGVESSGPEVAAASVAEASSGEGSSAEASTLEVDAGDSDASAGAAVTWDLPVTYNDRVEYWIDFLKGRNKDRTHLWLEREGKYGAFIREKLAARGMPEDLLYLGMIESGLSPRAYSRAAAAGLWQFIAETGRRYGLEVSTYVDERRDPIAATDAALDYLSDLYERFGSWYLAAAAYNSGENRVERVLRQRAGGQKGDDGLFWRIDGYLPRETRDYVPLMLAAGHIGKEPNKYGFHGLEHQAPLAFEEVKVPGGVPLAAVARAAGVELDDVSDLNTHLVRGMTPPGRAWSVRVPVGTGGKVAADLERMAKEERLATVEHRVRRGETLSHIAKRYGTSVDVLRSSNGGLNPRRLQVGDRIRVPVGGTTLAAGASSSPARQTWSTYRVQRGDTLWEIARRHGVSVGQLRSWNGIGSRIYPGQRIRIQA